MSEQEYEYVVIELPGYDRDLDRNATELINSVAALGWRLVSVAPTSQYSSAAYFERPL